MARPQAKTPANRYEVDCIMPPVNFRSITISKKVYDKLRKHQIRPQIVLEEMLKERKALLRFAKKIKKFPKVIRVYTIPYMTKKESGV